MQQDFETMMRDLLLGTYTAPTPPMAAPAPSPHANRNRLMGPSGREDPRVYEALKSILQQNQTNGVNRNPIGRAAAPAGGAALPPGMSVQAPMVAPPGGEMANTTVVAKTPAPMAPLALGPGESLPPDVAPGPSPMAPPMAAPSPEADFVNRGSDLLRGTPKRDFAAIFSDVMAGVGDGPGPLSAAAGGFNRATAARKARESGLTAEQQAAEDRAFDVMKRETDFGRDASRFDWEGQKNLDAHRKAVTDLRNAARPMTPEQKRGLEARFKSIEEDLTLTADEKIAKINDLVSEANGGGAGKGAQSYKEGTMAVNPKTGQRIEFKGGQWVDEAGKPIPSM